MSSELQRASVNVLVGWRGGTFFEGSILKKYLGGSFSMRSRSGGGVPAIDLGGRQSLLKVQTEGPLDGRGRACIAFGYNYQTSV